MSATVRTTVNLGKTDWEFVVEDAKRVLDTDDYRSKDDFNFSKYCRRVIAARKAALREPRGRKAA